MKTETTYGGPQGVDKPISHEAWSASVEPSSDNVVVLTNRKRDVVNPEEFLLNAKKLVIKNYNDHRNSRNLPSLAISDVDVVQFTKAAGNLKASITSQLAKGLLWEVTYNGQKSEVYLDTYRKVHHLKTPTKDF